MELNCQSTFSTTCHGCQTQPNPFLCTTPVVPSPQMSLPAMEGGLRWAELQAVTTGGPFPCLWARVVAKHPPDTSGHPESLLVPSLGIPQQCTVLRFPKAKESNFHFLSFIPALPVRIPTEKGEALAAAAKQMWGTTLGTSKPWQQERDSVKTD